MVSKIDVKGISAKDQQKIIDAWIMRQMQKMSVKNESEGNRVALIVACDRYSDPKLKQLQAPSQDAERFARILEDPKIGGFRVTTSY